MVVPTWKERILAGGGEGVEVDHPPISKELKKRWSHFIQRVEP